MLQRLCVALCALLPLASACGDDNKSDDGGDSPDDGMMMHGQLSDFFPTLPDATGEAQVAFAGQVTTAAQLPTGPATSGLVGDYFIKNDKVTFIIQSPTRVIGVIPQGGNVVDAVLTDGTNQINEDHFGELALIYKIGRTCEPDKVEVIRDGAGGGVAVIRASGKTSDDDFLNIKGIGILPVDDLVDPAIPDTVDCATTYILNPHSTTLEVHHSLFNNGARTIDAPLGTIADTGGEVEAWTNARGFERADISALATLGSPQPSDYTVYQGPGVAYGVIPRHDTPTTHTQALVAGVSIILDGNTSLLDILSPQKYFLHMPQYGGVRQQYDLVVGKDGADVDEVFRKGETLKAVSGHVTFSAGGNAEGARVGVFADGNNNGMLDGTNVVDTNGAPVDKIVSYMDVGADGSYSGNLPTTAGALFLRAEVKNIGRSPAKPVADSVDLVVPSPIKVDFSVTDDATGEHIPARLLVIGEHPALPDKRVFETYDRLNGVVTQQHAIRGTSTGTGEVDAPLLLPAGGTYRVYASRGTEWSIASAAVAGTADTSIALALNHVNPAVGYYSTDWHVHQIGSPDSNVPSDERVRSAVTAGTEMFAVTDHDYVSDLQSIVEDLNLQDYLRVVPGIEVTPFAYGHYNTWPLTPDDSANHGAIDWARVGATEGFGMLPGEIYAAMRARGGKMVQVNHPRGTGFTQFQAGFDRANLNFDYTNRIIFGDYENAGVPNDFLRLPEASLWSDQFNGLEVWNGFAVEDKNMDGVREIRSLDRVMRDWFSMLSLGMFVTPEGNSDTHTTVSDPVGMPRTYVRVNDDSASALAAGTAVDDVLATQLGSNGRPRDIVVTNGPFIDVKVNNLPALGRVVTGSSVTLTVTLTSPDWAVFDTLEVFANTTPDKVVTASGPTQDQTAITPLKCFTSRPLGSLAANDVCKIAPLAAQAMTVTLANVSGPGNHKRYEATVTVTLDASDINTRAGATGQDAWLVFRVRGARSIFPILPQDAITEDTLPALLTGDPDTVHSALEDIGVPATAFTSPVFVDFDGGGYKAPFAP